MKFVSSRELRIKPGAVWTLLAQEKDLVIANDGNEYIYRHGDPDSGFDGI